MIAKLTKNKILEEFFRYFFVGLLCAVLDLFFLYLLVEFLNIWYLLAATISFSVITYGGYFLQKKFTFRNTSRNDSKKIFIFVLVSICGLIANAASMYVLVGIFGIWYILSNIITKIIVLLWNFLTNKYITFNNKYEA